MLKTSFICVGGSSDCDHRGGDPPRSETLEIYVIITVPANDLVAQIHDRMPPIGA